MACRMRTSCIQTWKPGSSRLGARTKGDCWQWYEHGAGRLADWSWPGWRRGERHRSMTDTTGRSGVAAGAAAETADKNNAGMDELPEEAVLHAIKWGVRGWHAGRGPGQDPPEAAGEFNALRAARMPAVEHVLEESPWPGAKARAQAAI